MDDLESLGTGRRRDGDGMVTVRRRDGDGTVTGRSRSRKKNADSTVILEVKFSKIDDLKDSITS